MITQDEGTYNCKTGCTHSGYFIVLIDFFFDLSFFSCCVIPQEPELDLESDFVHICSRSTLFIFISIFVLDKSVSQLDDVEVKGLLFHVLSTISQLRRVQSGCRMFFIVDIDGTLLIRHSCFYLESKEMVGHMKVSIFVSSISV